MGLCCARVGDDPVDDAPDGPLCDAQQLAHRRLRAVGGEPGDQAVKGHRMARAVARPRHERDRRSVGGTGNARRVGLEETAQAPEIEAAPPAPPLALVMAGCSSYSARSDADGPCAGARGRRGLLAVRRFDLHVLDHGAVVDTDQLPP